MATARDVRRIACAGDRDSAVRRSAIAKQKICCTAFRFDLFLLQRALFCCGASYIVKVAPRRVMHLFVMGKLEMPKPREYAFRRKS
jgi:hypothetical protein